MRQRKIRNLDEKLAAHGEYMIEDPEKYRGSWARAIMGAVPSDGCADGSNEPAPFYLEIGCGKGQFLARQAEKHPDRTLLGVEGHRSVALHALEKLDAGDLHNARILLQYINGMDELFADGEVDGIYLNFSDPWPKERHAKRRLTSGKRLGEYARVLKRGGVMEFKTDNQGLFEYSLDEIRRQPEFCIVSVSRNLHADADPAELVTTEYEDKFSAQGQKICFLRAVRR